MAIKFKMPADPVKGWTRDEIIPMLLQSDKAVGRALLAIYERQTQDEQSAGTTKYHNGVGFSAFDAEIMTSMARFYRKNESLTPKQLAWLRACPGKQKTPRIGKYAGQLADIANAKIEHAIMEMEVTK